MTVLPDIDVWGSHGTAVKSVTIQDMLDRGKFLTLDQVRETLATTEPCESVGFPVSSEIEFKLDMNWEYDAAKMAGTDLVDAYVKIRDKEYRLTKDAILGATSTCGLSTAYVLKTPAPLITPHLNFWYKGGFDDHKEFKALTVGGDKCLAVMKGTIEPFSNLRLLEKTLDAIEARYGESEVYADSKFTHSLRRTDLRLITPAYMRQMADTGEDNDNWLAGIQHLNSLIGERQTSFDAYMFRILCTNGAIDTCATSGKWSRKSGGQGEEVYEWARAAVDSVLGGLEDSLDMVQAMTEISVGEEASDVLEEIFDNYGIPGAARQLVTENMVNSDDLTMYGIMQAITAAANEPDVDPNHVIGLMEAGGSLPRIANQRCGSCKRFTANGHEH